MAADKEDGCRLVRDQRFIKGLVDTMGSWIEAQDLAVPGLINIAEGQPLRLKLIRAIQAADDPDRDFLLQAEVGLPVRHPGAATANPTRLRAAAKEHSMGASASLGP